MGKLDDKQQHVINKNWHLTSIIQIQLCGDHKNTQIDLLNVNKDTLRIYVTGAQLIMARGVFEDATQGINTQCPMANGSDPWM